MMQASLAQDGIRSFFVRWMSLLTLCFAAFITLTATSVGAQDEFLDPDDAFVFSAAMATPERVDVHFKIASDYYMYRDRFEFYLEPESEAHRLGEPVLPQGLVKYDPNFDEDMEVFYGQYSVQIPVAAGADEALTLTVVSQGCADAGLCYVPTDHVLTLLPTATGYTVQGEGVVDQVPDLSASTAPEAYGDYSQAVKAQAGITDTGGSSALQASGLREAAQLGDTGFAAYLSQASWVEVVLLSALFGLLLSFTPCVLPMVPILLAILAGGGQSPATLSRWRGLSLAAAFVLGMSVVYTIVGVAAGLVGASLAVWLQTPWVLALFAALLALLALAMFDVFTLQAPSGMQSRLNTWMDRLPGGRYGGVFLMGMISALIVGPCVAAPLAGVLLFISQTGDVVLGGSALFSMAWGEGLLLLAVGASSGALLPRAGAWMERIKHFFGILLLATAWWMLNSVLPAWLNILGWAVLALWCAGLLGALHALPDQAGPGSLLGKALGIVLLVWGVLLVISVAAGGRDVLQPLRPIVASAGFAGAQSGASTPTANQPQFVRIESNEELDHLLANTDRPVMLDFYADWCVSCIEMERFTFSDPEVAQRMSRLTLVQADVTRNQPAHRDLLKRFNLFGPPGIVFFDAQGELITDARVVGFQNAVQFANVLDGVLR